MIDMTNVAKSAPAGYILMFAIYVIMVAISTVFASKMLRLLQKQLKTPSVKSVVFILLGWAGIELIFALALNAFWMGRNGSWDGVVPFMSLTPIAVLTPLRFLTRLFGYFGTSAVIGTGLVLIVASVKQPKWRILTAYYCTIILSLNLALWLGYSSATGPDINAVITSEELTETPQIINASNSDIVVLPEYGLDEYSNENIADRFQPSDENIYFTGTKQSWDTRGNKNVLTYGSTQEGYTDEYVKSRLIMAGEYLPFSLEVMTRTFAPDVYTDFQVRRAIVKGEVSHEPYSLPSGAVIGNGACSSIISPEDYRKLSDNGATVLSNSASLEIFSGSRVFEVFHSGLAKYMAVSNSRPFLQSANNWDAFAVDHNGNKIAETEPISQKNVTIRTNTQKTPYTHLGEWLSYLGVIFVVVVLAKKLLGQKPRGKSSKK